VCHVPEIRCVGVRSAGNSKFKGGDKVWIADATVRDLGNGQYAVSWSNTQVGLSHTLPLSLSLPLSLTHSHSLAHTLTHTLIPGPREWPVCCFVVQHPGGTLSLSHTHSHTRSLSLSLTHTHALAHTHSHTLTHALSHYDTLALSPCRDLGNGQYAVSWSNTQVRVQGHLAHKKHPPRRTLQ